MALTIAQVENIVCRVCYLATAEDPHTCREKQLHLTPNSVNIYGRSMLLADTLAIGGYAHCEIEQAPVDSDDEEGPENTSQQRVSLGFDQSNCRCTTLAECATCSFFFFPSLPLRRSRD